MMAEITGGGDLKAQPATVTGVGEVSPSAKDFIESRRQVPAGESEPDILYHYTSAAGLIGILEKGKIWATSIRHLSDASEFIYTLSLADRSSQNFLNPNFSFDRYLIDSLSVVHTSDLMPPALCYVASFSEHGNLLSQWRTYCPSGAGFSLGFSREELAAAAEAKKSQDQPWRLLRCSYDLEGQAKVLSGFLKEARAALEILPDNKKNAYLAHMRNSPELLEPGPGWVQAVTEKYVRSVETVAPSFKDSAFEEEAEWRVVSPLTPIWNYQDEKYRAGRYCPIPYAEFNLPAADRQLRLEKIMIGPTENPDLAHMTVERICRRYGVSVALVDRSEIPFRHWDSK